MMGFFSKKSEIDEHDVHVGLRARALSTNQRMRLYSQLHLYLKNNHKLDVALTEMYNIYSEDGKKPRAESDCAACMPDT